MRNLGPIQEIKTIVVATEHVYCGLKHTVSFYYLKLWEELTEEEDTGSKRLSDLSKLLHLVSG